MKRIQITKYLYWIALASLFAISIGAYMLGGETWYNASYYSAQLFFMNYEAPEKESILIYVCRVLCPVMTAAGVLALLKNIFQIVADNITSRMKNATAVYCDTEQMAEVGKTFVRPIFMADKANQLVKEHVLLFKDDMTSLLTYERMKAKLQPGSKVYIKLEHMDSALLKNCEANFFHINEIIAREYWQKRHLREHMKNGKLDIKIAIIGFKALGQKILDYGLMNNIYSLEQSIKYHVWGECKRYRDLLSEFDKMNEDTITFHDVAWEDDINYFKDFDRIIIAEETLNIELLQALLYLGIDAEIDIYNPLGTQLAMAYEGEKITTFGEKSKLLTEENIKSDKLYRSAKELNYAYCVSTDQTGTYTWDCPNVETLMSSKWEELDNFKKGSNISCADYHNIRLLCMDALKLDKEKLTANEVEMLAEMEHIRWCRYHFVNHWSYADERDNNKRQHHLLVPYMEIQEEEKQKDREMVQMLLS